MDDSPKRLLANGEENLGPRRETSAEVPGDLASTRAAPSILDWDFDAPEPEPRRLGLHLDGPAEVAVLHLKLGERAKGHGAKGPEIRELRVPDQAEERAGQGVAEPLDGRERAWLGLTFDPRADDEIGETCDHGKNHGGQILGRVGPVRVEEDDDVGRRERAIG